MGVAGRLHSSSCRIARLGHRVRLLCWISCREGRRERPDVESDFRQQRGWAPPRLMTHESPSRSPADMSIDIVGALLVFLFPLAYSPGPGNTFFAAIGASQGVKAAAPALAGYHVATLVVTALVGLGLGSWVLEVPVVANALATVGGVYVLWLAWLFIRSAKDPAPHAPAQELRIGFWSGAVVLLLNPKAYYIIAVMFTQFLPSASRDDVHRVIAITVVFTLNNLVAFLAWTVAGRTLTTLFGSRNAQRRIDYVFGATLVAVAVWMFVPVLA